ncbi:MAG: class I SAM-dependent methyltransferase [Thermoplasmataceae archaeon]
MDHAGGKEEHVKRVFSSINRKYDLVDSLISFGLDQHWRRILINEIGIRGGATILDCGAGTGKLTEELGQKCPDCMIISVDITEEMFRKPKTPNARFMVASADSVPLPDGSVDFVLSSYLTRNLSDVGKYFKEAYRLLRKGGRIGNLDIYNPPGHGFSTLFSIYFYHIVPIFGNLITGTSAYTYLAQSVMNFHTPGKISEMLENAGFRNVRSRRLMLGSIYAHWGEKS